MKLFHARMICLLFENRSYWAKLRDVRNPSAVQSAECRFFEEELAEIKRNVAEFNLATLTGSQLPIPELDSAAPLHMRQLEAVLRDPPRAAAATLNARLVVRFYTGYQIDGAMSFEEIAERFQFVDRDGLPDVGRVKAGFERTLAAFGLTHLFGFTGSPQSSMDMDVAV